MEGTCLGSAALPLPDGPLLRHVAVAAGIRERQPSRNPGCQGLGLRPSVPFRMAGAATYERRQLVHLLKFAGYRAGVPGVVVQRRCSWTIGLVRPVRSLVLFGAFASAYSQGRCRCRKRSAARDLYKSASRPMEPRRTLTSAYTCKRYWGAAGGRCW